MRVLPIALLGACQSDESEYLRYSCPFVEIGAVGPAEAGDLGFTAEQVLRAASASSSGTTLLTERATEAFPVALTHTFALAGEVTVVEFDPSGFGGCPTGRALRVPATYELAGTIGEWSVGVADEGFAMVATTADVGGISTDWSVLGSGEHAPSNDRAQVALELEAWIRSTGPGAVDVATCEMTFDLTPLPKELTAGAWGQELMDGGLYVSCANAGWTVFRWLPDVVAPLE